MCESRKGIYVLEIQIPESSELKVGSLPNHEYEGKYIYVGSALGPGGYSRVERHLDISADRTSGGHWHVDSLLEAGQIRCLWLLPTEEDLECKLAGKLARSLDQPVKGFGASDCDCYSHLFSLTKGDRKELIKTMVDFQDQKPLRFDCI